MQTAVLVTRGPLKGRRGWISGDLESRANRGITKALIHADANVELVAIAALAVDAQLELGLQPCAKTQKDRRRALAGAGGGSEVGSALLEAGHA